MNDGGPAFPEIVSIDAEACQSAKGNIKHNVETVGGMSLRDWFAGMAMQGLIKEALDRDHIKWDATAQHAYIIADTMLKERET